MADEKGPLVPTGGKAEETPGQSGPRSKDEVALELMKFIVATTGYGRGATAAGFSAAASRGANAGKSPEESADAILNLFERCRSVLAKPV